MEMFSLRPQRLCDAIFSVVFFIILSPAVRIIQCLLCCGIIFPADTPVKAYELVEDKTMLFTQLSNLPYFVKGQFPSQREAFRTSFHGKCNGFPQTGGEVIRADP